MDNISREANTNFIARIPNNDINKIIAKIKIVTKLNCTIDTMQNLINIAKKWF